MPHDSIQVLRKSEGGKRKGPRQMKVWLLQNRKVQNTILARGLKKQVPLRLFLLKPKHFSRTNPVLLDLD